MAGILVAGGFCVADSFCKVSDLQCNKGYIMSRSGCSALQHSINSIDEDSKVKKKRKKITNYYIGV